MAGLEQEGDDRVDDEDRLEAFAQDDQERLQEGSPSSRRRARQLDDRRQTGRYRIARLLGTTDVARFDRALEVGELPFEVRDKTWALRSRRRLERLERDVRIEGAVPGIGGPTGARRGKRLIQQ